MATQSSAWTGEKPRKAGNGAGRGSAARSGEKVVPISPTGSAQDIHRTPPHSVDAEQGVLGSMLISPRETIAECVEKINEEYFYVPAHRTIYNILVDLWNAGQAIDLITFTQVLRDRHLLDSVGGAAFVTSLFTFVPTAANVGYYLEIVRDKYILREIISASTESVRRAYEEQDEVNNLLDEVEQRIFAVGEDRFKGQMLSMKDQVMDAIESIEKLYERKGGITGISTGFVEFDRMTSGLHPSEMIVIAARPSMGKTALAMNIAEHVAINEKLQVGVFSLEMSSQQLVQRLLCSRAKVNLQKVRDGFLGERDFPSSDRRSVETGGSEDFHRRQRKSQHSRVARESASTQSPAGCAAAYCRLSATAKIDVSPRAGQSAAGNIRNFRRAERVGEGIEDSNHCGGPIEPATRAALGWETALERSARIGFDRTGCRSGCFACPARTL